MSGSSGIGGETALTYAMSRMPVALRNTPTEAIQRWLTSQLISAPRSDTSNARVSLQSETPCQR